MQGWIKLHRELTQKAIWLESTPEHKVVLITLLTMANHDEKEWEWRGQRYKAKPGQFVTSLPSIAQKCGRGISIQNIRSALKRFEKYGFLTDESTNRNRLITITNWDVYQGSLVDTNSQTNRQLTGNQQATNRQLTANKNDKNDKNDKNIDHHLSDEIQNVYFKTFGTVMTKHNFDVINSYLQDGLTEWHICEALRRTAENNKQTFRYTMGILNNWMNRKAFTKEDVENLDKLHQPQRSRLKGPITSSDFSYSEPTQQDTDFFTFLEEGKNDSAKGTA